MQLPKHVRQFIENTLADLGAPQSAPSHETYLVRNGYDCGRRFDRNGFQAVWFVEENQVKFYAPNGAMLCACEPLEPYGEHSRVA